MSQELDRNFGILKQKADPPPYFISYEVTDQDYRSLSGVLGAVTPAAAGKSRSLDVSVRVGSPQLDNYHRVRGSSGQVTSGTAITYEDNVNSIKRRLWLETDRAYRSAAQRLIQIQTNSQVRVAAADNSADFSQEQPSVAIEAPPKMNFDEAGWSGRIRKLSARFGDFPAVVSSRVSVACEAETKYLVSTEGTRIQHGRGFARVVISAAAKAADGTDLETFDTYEAVDCAALPKDEVIQAGIDRVANDLGALLEAPVVDPFVGPAIFPAAPPASSSMRSSATAWRASGRRTRPKGQTFTKSVGKPVLPEFPVRHLRPDAPRKPETWI